MKLFKVFNGYVGQGPVNILVCCENKKQALELAGDAFRDRSEIAHSKDFWLNLEAELLCDDLDKSWVGEIED